MRRVWPAMTRVLRGTRLAPARHDHPHPKETTVARALMVLVFAPAGGFVGKAVAEASAGRPWGPWLLTALVWLVLSGLASVAVSNRLGEHR